MTCFENETAVWNETSVNASALHLLAEQCLNVVGSESGTGERFVGVIQAPNTFFVQLVRLSVCLCIVTVLVSLYNTVRVLEQPIVSTATCSLFWVLFFTLASVKSLLLVILLPAGHVNNIVSHRVIERCGFIVITVIQLAASYVLYLALHHETQFRSSEFATIDSPPRRSCIGLRGLKSLCSWHRIIVMVITLVPLIYLVAIEVSFSIASGEVLPSGVVWPFILLLLLPRAVAIGVAVYLMLRPKHYLLQPTVLAKVYLGIATVLSLMEDVPNSVVTIAPPHTPCTCVLGVLSVYDLLQLLGLVAFIFYLLFVRSQYLRVEQESKLNLVEGLQKLLEVNGRKDVIRKDYTT